MIGDNELSFLLYGAGALFLLGIVLSYLARSKGSSGDDTAQKLEKALPGAQCAQCGYPGCRAYAEAMANGTAPCNKCTPGGQDTVDTLAEILGVSVPTDESDDAIFTPRTRAYVLVVLSVLVTALLMRLREKLKWFTPSLKTNA